jgi:hypothetical protein
MDAQIELAGGYRELNIKRREGNKNDNQEWKLS